MDTRNETLLDAAIDYTDRGLRVIALTGKAPNVAVHRRGLYDAFSAGQSGQEGMGLAFTHKDTTGIGILTGDPYYVVDIDGEEGATAWAKIQHGLVIPEAWVASTGRGLHIWYGHSSMFCGCGVDFHTAKLGEKLDFKGTGGYVAAPPSLHPNGNFYKWLLSPSDGPPHEMPEDLHTLLVMQERMKQQRQLTGSMQKREKHQVLEGGLLWNTFNFDGPVNAVRNAESGNRNATLHWAACVLGEDGASAQDFADLYEAAVSTGLDGREVMQTMRSARKKVGA